MKETDEIEMLLDSYADSLEYFEGGGSVDRSGPHKTGGPLVRKRKLAYLLKHQAEDVLVKYESEYAELNERFEELRGELGEEYERGLRAELDHYLSIYPSVVCYAFDPETMDIELDNDLATRDHLEHLLMEFEETEDLHDERMRVAGIDDVLRCKFELNTETLRRNRNLIEQPYLPETFWWRHIGPFLD